MNKRNKQKNNNENASGNAPVTYPEILKDSKNRVGLSIIACLIAIGLIAFLVSSGTNGMLKFILSMIILGINGVALKYLLGMEGEFGLLLFRLKNGDKGIEKLWKIFGKYWNNLTDIGLVMGFGLTSKLGFKHINNKNFGIGVICILFSVVVLGFSGVIAISLMNIPLESLMQNIRSASSIPYLSYISLAITIVFGVVGFAIFSIVMNAGQILASIVAYLLGDTTALAASSPGVYPVLPYFTIPLFEGLIAMLVLMVVHEGSHGISALISKIKLKSTGLITLGFIPVGAFVDIDEKQLDKGKKIDNARVSVAGSAANMFVAFIFFIPTIAMLLAMPAFQEQVITVTGTIKNLTYTGDALPIGTKIYFINGTQISNVSQYSDLMDSFKSGEAIMLSTDKGTTETKLIIDGQPGFSVAQPLKSEFWYLKPIYATLGLITVLNLLVGIINLLPLPAFDGHRLFKLIFKKEKVVTAITAIIVVAFLMNIVPWIWQ